MAFLWVAAKQRQLWLACLISLHCPLRFCPKALPYSGNLETSFDVTDQLCICSILERLSYKKGIQTVKKRKEQRMEKQNYTAYLLSQLYLRVS